MIVTDGYDGTIEELYFANAVAALERGYHVLVFDGPGQGSVITELGLPFRPDWENVMTPVIDYALELPGVDPDRFVLLGWSFGGYLAPRAATGEHRIAACVADSGPYDLRAATLDRIPGPLASRVARGSVAGHPDAASTDEIRDVEADRRLGTATGPVQPRSGRSDRISRGGDGLQPPRPGTADQLPHLRLYYRR